jgi:hypothetical protein
MSVVPNSVFANSDTPCFAPPGGGGGSYPTDASFNTVNILEGGEINIGSSINSGTNLNFYKDVPGTLQTVFGMSYIGGNSPSNLCLTLFDQTSGPDAMLIGASRFVASNAYDDATPFVSLDARAGGSGFMSWVEPGSNTSESLMSVGVVGSNARITDINGKGLPQAGIDTTVGASNVVTLPYAYTDSNYAVCVTPWTVETMSATVTSSNSFTVVTGGSNVQYQWITMPY